MSKPQQIRIPMGIPLIGQGPPPEQKQRYHTETAVLVDLWPTHPIPRAADAEFWMGETMLHKFALKAMEILGQQLAAKSKTDEELADTCRRAWKVAVFMHKLAPIGQKKQEPEQPDPSSPED